MVKRKTKKKAPKRKGRRDEDTRQRRKFKRGARVEAYTFGEALGKKRWP